MSRWEPPGRKNSQALEAVSSLHHILDSMDAELFHTESNYDYLIEIMPMNRPFLFISRLLCRKLRRNLSWRLSLIFELRYLYLTLKMLTWLASQLPWWNYRWRRFSRRTSRRWWSSRCTWSRRGRPSIVRGYYFVKISWRFDSNRKTTQAPLYNHLVMTPPFLSNPQEDLRGRDITSTNRINLFSSDICRKEKTLEGE